MTAVDPRLVGDPAFVEKWFGLPASERRELRGRALTDATYVHGDANMLFERDEAIAEILKTAQQFYDWIVTEDGGAR